MAEWTLPPGVATRHEAHFGDRIVRCFADRVTDIYDTLARAVAARGAAEAVICGSERLTYAEFGHRVERVAGGLAARGIGPGDRVALLLGNRVEFLLAVYAALRLGAIAVPMGTRLQTPEIAYILDHAGARALVVEPELLGRLPARTETPELTDIYVPGAGSGGGIDAEDFALLDGEPPPRVAVAEEDTAVILYTSGTTGRPKGAMLTHFNLTHSLLHFQYGMKLTSADRMLLAVPASHVTGLVALIMLAVQAQGALIMMPEFRARPFLELASRERMTNGILVPAMYNLCLLDPDFDRFDLSAWRVGGYGGAPMPAATIAALAEKLPNLGLMNAYGATETTSPTTMMPAHYTRDHADSVGLVLPCADVIVMNPDGQEVAPGESGEIWIRGAMTVPGYWRNAEATAREFTAGYWHSGDVGSKDAQGFVRVFDRVKDMLNRGGYKVYSVEVENVLAGHDGVLESAIVAKPCPVLGERVHAFISRRRHDVTAEELRSFCAARLADYKVPESYTLLDEPLPRNANGKLMKRTLRERLLAGMA